MRRKIFDQKFNMGMKTQNLMLILNPLEKLQNLHAKKVIDEKVMGNRSFLILFSVYKSFRSITLWVKFFFIFSSTDETAQKNEKVFYKCLQEFHFASFSGLGGCILSKRSKSMYPSGQAYSAK